MRSSASGGSQRDWEIFDDEIMCLSVVLCEPPVIGYRVPLVFEATGSRGPFPIIMPRYPRVFLWQLQYCPSPAAVSRRRTIALAFRLRFEEGGETPKPVVDQDTNQDGVHAGNDLLACSFIRASHLLSLVDK